MIDILPPFIYFTLWIPYSLILYLKPEKGGNPFSVAEPPCIGHYKEYLPLNGQPTTVDNLFLGSVVISFVGS